MTLSRIQIRRGTSAQWAAANPILALAEPGLDTTTGVLKYGDGVTAWSALPQYPTSKAPLGLVARTGAWDAPTVGTAQLVPAGATLSGVALTAGRNYAARMELSSGWYGTAANDGFSIGISLDGANIGGVLPIQTIVTNQYLPPGSMVVPFTASTGNHTLIAYCQRTSGTGSLQFRGRLMIYDEGGV